MHKILLSILTLPFYCFAAVWGAIVAACRDGYGKGREDYLEETVPRPQDVFASANYILTGGRLPAIDPSKMAPCPPCKPPPDTKVYTSHTAPPVIRPKAPTSRRYDGFGDPVYKGPIREFLRTEDGIQLERCQRCGRLCEQGNCPCAPDIS